MESHGRILKYRCNIIRYAVWEDPLGWGGERLVMEMGRGGWGPDRFRKVGGEGDLAVGWVWRRQRNCRTPGINRCVETGREAHWAGRTGVGLKMTSLGLSRLGGIRTLRRPSTDRSSLPLQGERFTTAEADFITAGREPMGEEADNPAPVLWTLSFVQL